jgi:hypothetical protein
MTVPDVAKRDVLAFFNSEPLWKQLKAKNKVIRTGGTQVRVIRVKSEHSTVVQIDDSNLLVPSQKKQTLSPMTGDWAKYGKAIILPHPDLDRMQTREEKKRYIKAQTDACVQSLMNDFVRQLYIGTISNLLGFATFHGARTTGTSSGFQNGALQFLVPTSQTSTYLNETRSYDTTNEVNHWHNQFIAHSGIGTNFLRTVEKVKGRADTFDPGEGGISLGIVSIDDLALIGDEARAYPGGAGGTGVMYTPQDAASGKIHKLITSIGGVNYFANRWMTATNMGLTGACYLLNPDWIELWVNAGHDFQVGKFVNRLETTGEDADVAILLVELQAAIPNLMANGCTSQ